MLRGFFSLGVSAPLQMRRDRSVVCVCFLFGGACVGVFVFGFFFLSFWLQFQLFV